jgi:hypothetical protein
MVASASIRLFGNGGEMLRKPVMVRNQTISENAYILTMVEMEFSTEAITSFYANGPDKWSKDSIISDLTIKRTFIAIKPTIF